MKPITAKEFLELKKTHPNTALVDVREPFEVEEKRIVGSIPIPRKELSSKYSLLTSYDCIVLQCRSGGRAKDCAITLKSLGLKNIYYFVTYIDDWEKEGLEILFKGEA